MSLEFISLERDRRDKSNFRLKAKKTPGILARIFGFRKTEQLYYGNGRVWYEMPSGELVRDTEVKEIRQMLEKARITGKLNAGYNF